ncbi:MAG: hypothetical protein EHM35_12180 [Planctomycetaceae bacterium]|nr:MAG: hypothetical protein EHM35_12180 [Planctomycetaceae bacterium]
MPYAPGVDYEAGKIFAAMGPRINENIQTFMNHRRDRQQMTATAEMLGRYIAKDPQAMEMFGEDLAKIPDMSLGKAKGTLGGLTAYLAQRHLDSAEAAQKQSLDIAQKNHELLAGEAAERLQQRQRVAKFNELLSREMNPPLMYTSAVGRPEERPGITADTIARLGAESGTLADPSTTSLLSAIGANEARRSGLPLGQVVTTRSGDRLIGMGYGNAPNVQPAKAVKGMAVGTFVPVAGGGRVIGTGEENPPHFEKADTTTGKLSEGDKTFRNVAPEYARMLDEYEALVNRFGNTETQYFGDPEAAAKLGSLPYQMAIAYAKLVDPASVAREGEVTAAKKYLIPSGWHVPNEVTLKAIKAQRADLANRIKTWQENTGSGPEAIHNLPPSVGGVGASSFKSPEDVRAAYQAGKLSAEAAAQILQQQFGMQSGGAPAPGSQ